MNKIDTKNIIIDILYKNSKQKNLFFRLEKMGVDLDRLSISLLDNILDLIGFPEEPKEIREDPDPFYIPKEGDFFRDYLSNEYFEKVLSIYSENTSSELRDVSGIEIFIDQDLKIKEVTVDYVNWLYSEYEKIK